MGSTGNSVDKNSPTPIVVDSTPKLVDEFNGALGDRTEVKLDDVITAATNHELNPNYTTDVYNGLYHINCALCATAFVLAANGYDVEAMPYDKKQWRGFDSIYDVDFSNPDNFIVNGGGNFHYTGMPTKYELKTKYGVGADAIPQMPKGANAAAKSIIEKMKTWGDGSIAIMMVDWNHGGGSHAVNLVNQGGTIKMVDPQTGKSTTDLTSYLKLTSANHTAIVRMDTATVKSAPKDLDKIVKKKEKK